jgi:hypothetical protein
VRLNGAAFAELEQFIGEPATGFSVQRFALMALVVAYARLLAVQAVKLS